jgi:hypothetical protein
MAMSVVPASAEPVVFRIDSTQSTMSLTPATFDSITGQVTSGSRAGNSVGIVLQTGGGQTALSGALAGDLTGGVFNIGAQSFIVALENPAPPFAPSPSQTGSSGMVDNFGAIPRAKVGSFQDFGVLAVRDFAATVVDPTLTLGGAADSLTLKVYSGLIDEVIGDDPNVDHLPEKVPAPQPNLSGQAGTGTFAGTIQIPYSLDVVVPITLPFFGTQQGHILLSGLIVATRAIPGDFNGSQNVNSLDFSVWKGAFGADALADADLDGDSDAADFLVWQRQFGVGGPVFAVPEPSAALLAIASLALACRFKSRWRCRR